MSDFDDEHGDNGSLDPRYFHPDGRPKKQPTGNYPNGYARTPEHTKFQPGDQGPRKGRKNGSLNLRTVWNRKMAEKLQGEVDGLPKRMTRREAHILDVCDKAFKAKHARSSAIPIELDIKINGIEEAPPAPKAPLSPVHQAIVDDMRRRLELNFGGALGEREAGATDEAQQSNAAGDAEAHEEPGNG